jgi:hypothetical protein
MNSLLSVSALGFLWLSLLFLLCFSLVHLVRLAKFGRVYQKQQQTKKTEPPPKPPETKTPPKPQSGEPIYYIVERKRRAKTSFSEPKPIQFK